MALIKSITLSFICILLLFSCKTEKDGSIQFPVTYQLKGQSLDVSAILGRTLMFKIKENKLILRDDNGDSQITIVDLDDPANYIYLSRRGEGPGEIINPSRVFLSNNGFSVFDGGKMSLFNFNMHEIEDEDYLPEGIFTTNMSVVPVTWEQLTDSLYITTGIFPENRFYFINNHGELVAQNGSYPFEFDHDYPFHVKGMASLSAIVKSPNQNRIATSTLYGGHIGIYEFDTEELAIKTVSETNLFSPQFTTSDYGGTPNFSPTENTRWGYLSIAADENYLYALYSGKYQQPGEEFYTGNVIHVFDWDGKPAYEIIMDHPAYYLDVYQGNLYTLYTVKEGNFDIAVYVLP